MPRDPFARLNHSLFSLRGEEAVLSGSGRSAAPCLAIFETFAVEVEGKDSSATATRDTVVIDQAHSPKRGDVVRRVRDGKSFRLDRTVAVRGFYAQTDDKVARFVVIEL